MDGVNEAFVARAVELLNEALSLDAVATSKLVMHREPCNAELADHPTIQCAGGMLPRSVSMLGMLNGIAGADTDGWGHIAAVVNDGGRVERFEAIEGKPWRVIERFEITGVSALADGTFGVGGNVIKERPGR